MKRIIGAAVILFVLVLSGCGENQQPQKVNFDYGKEENGKYVNQFFGFELDLPADWQVQTQETIEKLGKAAEEAAIGDNEELKKAVEASKVNNASLLGVFQHPIGADVEYNPNLMVVAENLQGKDVADGREYLKHTRKLLEESNIVFEKLSEEFERVQIDEMDFYLLESEVMQNGKLRVHQNYYVTIKEGFALGFALTYVSDDTKAVLEKSLNSIKFSK